MMCQMDPCWPNGQQEGPPIGQRWDNLSIKNNNQLELKPLDAVLWIQNGFLKEREMGKKENSKIRGWNNTFLDTAESN